MDHARGPQVQLLEREAELDRIQTLVDSAAGGQGRLLLVEGPAGIGKTELLQAACLIGRERRLAVCRARGSELERQLAYGVARQLLERAGLSLDGAARLAEPVLRPTATQAPEAAGSLEVLHGLYWACAIHAATRPLLLAIDDAHWADTASTRFLEYLARRVHELPVLIIATRRTTEPASDTPAFQGLALEPNVEHVTPAALSLEAVTELVHRQLAPDAATAFCHACHQATGGNPFLLRELLKAASAAGVHPTADSVHWTQSAAPRAVSRSVQLRLAALPADAAALARAVAVLGGNAELRHAAATAGLTVAAGARATDALEAAAILAPGRPLDFVHPLIRAGVYSTLRAGGRAEAHGRAARLLAEDGAAPGRIAVHLLATEPQDDEWTVAVLRHAAHDALAQGAPQPAVGYLRRALAEPPRPWLRAAVLQELGGAEQRVGDAAALGHLREALELATDARARASTVRLLALGLLWANRVADAEVVLDRTLAALARTDPELAVQLEAEVLSAARLSLTAGLWGAGRVERWRGRLHGNTAGERLMLANLATQTALGDATAAEAADLAERAAAGGRLLDEQTSDAMPFYQIIYVLTSADRITLAERLVEQAIDDARARGSVFGTILAALFGSYTALSRGDVSLAEARAWHALQLAGQFDTPLFHLPPCVGSVVDILVERGRLEEAERTLQAHGMTGELADTVPFRILLFSRANLRAAQGHWRQAADDLLELGRRQAGWRALNPHLVPQDGAAAIALAAVGEREPAAALARRAVARARRWGTGRAVGLALRALALAGQDAARIGLLQQAAAGLATSPARLDEARVLADLGVALRRAGRRTDAAATLRQALDLADRCGGLRLADRARDELRALGLRPRRAALTGMAALTGSERRVAELAASGSSNREIAQALFVTVRTVEVHLTHTYRKLGIRSRTELAKTLAGNPKPVRR